MNPISEQLRSWEAELAVRHGLAGDYEYACSCRSERMLRLAPRQWECHRTGLPGLCWSASFGQGPAFGTCRSTFRFRAVMVVGVVG
jgi:hypothetical protein